MDLFVVASPLSNRHRLALWKMSGTKLWDVEVGRGLAVTERITGIAWSPHGKPKSAPAQPPILIDSSHSPMVLINIAILGLQIALIHDPPRLSFHSVHDGREIYSVDPSPGAKKGATLTGIWWANGEKSATTNSTATLPDPMRRDGVVVSYMSCSVLLTLSYDDSQGLPILSSRCYHFWTLNPTKRTLSWCWVFLTSLFSLSHACTLEQHAFLGLEAQKHLNLINLDRKYQPYPNTSKYFQLCHPTLLSPPYPQLSEPQNLAQYLLVKLRIHRSEIEKGSKTESRVPLLLALSC
jgi:hypothetical protein